MVVPALHSTPASSARAALERQLRSARRGRTLLHPLLGAVGRVEPGLHYPRNDVVDDSGAWQFYFHAHGAPEGRRHPKEVGHIHLFRRQPNTGLTHVAGLSLSDRCMPLRWFSTNQWVTGEHWQDAAQVAQGLGEMSLRLAGPCAGLGAWLGDLVRFYARPITRMLHRRDLAIDRHCQRWACTRAEALSNRRIAVWSTATIHWPQDALLAPQH